MRKISPYVSLLLAILMLAGSSCLTITKHTCNYCGVQTILTSFEMAATDQECCCNHNVNTVSEKPCFKDYVFDNDCCTHEIEKLIADDLIQNEVQPEIIPFFIASAVVAIVTPAADSRQFYIDTDEPLHLCQDLTSFYCQMQA